MDDTYLLRNLGFHLARAGRRQELLALVEDPKWRRSQREGLGSDAGFLADIERAITAAEADGVDGLLHVMHLSLLETLVRSASGEVGAERIGALAQHGEMQTAFERANTMLDPRRKSVALLEVAEQAALQGNRPLAAQALAATAAEIAALPWPLRRAALWAEAARLEAVLGQTASARDNLDRALNIIRDQQQRPSQDQTPSFTTPEDIQSQLPGLQRMSERGDAAALAQACASAAVASAQLGDPAQARELLASLGPTRSGADYDIDAGKALATSALRLARLDHDDLATLAIDAIASRPTLSKLTPGGHLNLSGPGAGLSISPFAISALLDLADDLAALEKIELALRALQVLPTGASGAGALRDSKTAKVLSQTNDSAFLASWMAGHKRTAGSLTRAAVLSRLTELQAEQEALTLADRSPRDLATVAAALFNKGDDRQGEAVLQKALTASSWAPAPTQLKDKLTVAQALAEADDPERALTIWQAVKVDKASSELTAEDFADAGAAIAVSLARSGQLSQANAFINRNLQRSTRAQALASIGLALAESGQNDEAQAMFAQARQAVPGMLKLDDRIDALEALLDALIKAQVFDQALDVARTLDRTWAAGDVVDEPGILFRKAKDRLARAVGFDADEDLAIDTEPENQKRVIEAIAEAGDYQRARELASRIDNVAALEELLPAIAEAAGKAGDLNAAFAIVAETEEEDVDLDDLHALAVEAGELDKSRAASDEFEIGALAVAIAAASLLAMHADPDADQQLAARIDFTIEALHNADDDLRTLGVWLVDALFAVLTTLPYMDGVKTAIARLSAAKRRLRDEAVLDDHEEALTMAAGWLCDAHAFDDVKTLLVDLPSAVQRASLSIEIVCLQVFAGAAFDDSAVQAWLKKMDVDSAQRLKLFDEYLAAKVLAALRRDQATQAQSVIAGVQHDALRQDLLRILALHNDLRHSPPRPSIPEHLAALGLLPSLSDRLASFLMTLLVESGAADLAVSLLEQMHAQDTPALKIDQGSMWWHTIIDVRMKRTEDMLRRLTEPPQGRGEGPALALARALVAADPTGDRMPALQVVESQLSGARKIAGLMAVTQTAAAAGRHDVVSPAVLWRALATARGRGLWDTFLHIAALIPALQQAGGLAKVREVNQLCEDIQKRWLPAVA